MISVVILGSGNVGTHLYKAMKTSPKIDIIQWFSRSSKGFPAGVETSLKCNELSTLKLADIYIIAVSDKAIPDLSQHLPFENRLVVHTSGSSTIGQLDKKHRRGVFYPLQTFSKATEVNFKSVPFCIEAQDKSDEKLLQNLAAALDSPHYLINSEQRQALHLSAVFVNNFTNQLYRIAHELTDSKNINFDILKPLIMETSRKIQLTSPYIAQTGPAKRNDHKTIKQHLKLLESHPHYAELYEKLTTSIKHTHGFKKL